MSTHPLMLPFTSPREAFLACPPSPCSSSDPPLTRQGAAFAHLDFPPNDLVLWTDSSVPFHSAKEPACQRIVMRQYTSSLKVEEWT